MSKYAFRMTFKHEKNCTGNLLLCPAGSPTVTFIVRRKLTFTLPLRFNKLLSNSWRNPV